MREQEQKISIILGRSFLATGRTLIDVQKGEPVFIFQEDEVIFSMLKPLKHPEEENHSYLRMDLA